METSNLIYGKTPAQVRALVELVTGPTHGTTEAMYPDHFIKKCLKNREQCIVLVMGDESTKTWECEYGALGKALRDRRPEFNEILSATSGNTELSDRALLTRFIMFLIQVAAQETNGQTLPAAKATQGQQFHDDIPTLADTETTDMRTTDTQTTDRRTTDMRTTDTRPRNATPAANATQGQQFHDDIPTLVDTETTDARPRNATPRNATPAANATQARQLPRQLPSHDNVPTHDDIPTLVDTETTDGYPSTVAAGYPSTVTATMYPRTYQLVRFLLEHLLLEIVHKVTRVKKKAYIDLANYGQNPIVVDGMDRVDFRMAALQNFFLQLTGSSALSPFITLLENKRLAHDPNPPKGKDGKTIHKLKIGVLNKHWAQSVGEAEGRLSLAEACAFLTGTQWEHEMEKTAPVFDTRSGSSDDTEDCMPLDEAYQSLVQDCVDTEDRGPLEEAYRSALQDYLAVVIQNFPKGSAECIRAEYHVRNAARVLGGTESGTGSDAQESPLTLNRATNQRGFGFSANGLSCSSLGLNYMLHTLVKEVEALSPLSAPDKKSRSAVLGALNRGMELLSADWNAPTIVPETDPEKALAGSLHRIEDFELLEILGGGSFGRVFLVRHRENIECKVALKVQSYSLPDFVKHASREILDGSRVRHKNIAAILGIFPIPQVLNQNKPVCIGILMEALGPDLFDTAFRIDSDPRLPRWKQVSKYCYYTLQLLEALAVLNEHGVYHRDVKPENICMSATEKDVIKLVDFGLARVVDDNGTFTEGCGTGWYIPPEGSGSPKHDTYSAGLTFAVLLTDGHDVRATAPKVTDQESKDSTQTRKRLQHQFRLEGVHDLVAERIADICLGLCACETNRLSARQAIPFLAGVVDFFREEKP